MWRGAETQQSALFCRSSCRNWIPAGWSHAAVPLASPSASSDTGTSELSVTVTACTVDISLAFTRTLPLFLTPQYKKEEGGEENILPRFWNPTC
ncbi:hypothetical protein GN956_G9306 [Arapaima gigas]